MIAPPPIPNRPARIPVTTPPTMMAPASSASSESGTPVSTLGRDVRGLGARARQEVDCIAQHRNASPGLYGMRRDVTAERARARHPLKEAKDMSRHRVQPRAARKLALDVR